MDITQLVFTCIAVVGMLVVALLAIIPTLSELPTSHRHDQRSTDQFPVRPAKVRHP